MPLHVELQTVYRVFTLDRQYDRKKDITLHKGIHSVAAANEVVAHFLDNGGGTAGLDALWRVRNDDCLLGLDTHHALLLVLTVDGSGVRLDAELLQAFDVEAGHVQLRRVVEPGNNGVDLSGLQRQVPAVGPDTRSVRREDGGFVEVAGFEKVVGICCRKEESRGPVAATKRGLSRPVQVSIRSAMALAAGHRPACGFVCVYVVSAPVPHPAGSAARKRPAHTVPRHCCRC